MNPRLKNTFDFDYEGWQSYDYEASVRAGHEVFRPVTWTPTGGARDSGHVWTDDTRWTVDTPEQPRSILALVMYRCWLSRGPVDLRGATVSVFLRGDGLDLKGGSCCFWAWNLRSGTRWHMSRRPLPISPDAWADRPVEFRVENDAALWHRSWAIRFPEFGPLDRVLAEADSFGFSFLGFAEKVTGRLRMDEFEIRPPRARSGHDRQGAVCAPAGGRPLGGPPEHAGRPGVR
jgi:hypothetical protein